MFDTIISGATIVNAAGNVRGNVAIRGGRVAAILPPADLAEARTIVDANGCHLLPGLVDVHAHLREPGLTHKEDFDSGTRAAALGGVTTVLDMPTDDPWTATADQLAAKMETAKGRIHVDVGFQAVISRNTDLLRGLVDLRPVSLELFTADVPEAFMFESMDAVAEMVKWLDGREMLIGISPGDQSILAGSGSRNPAGDIAAFLQSRPPLAEASGLARAVLAAAGTKVSIHVRQVNSALGVSAWRRLRDMADATIETTPQNFFFTSADYERLGAGLKGSPPFRAPSDVEALRAALSEGLIDIVGTDHAPHSPAEKATSYTAFADIPGGMPGLQTLLATMLRLIEEDVINFNDLVRMSSFNPARRFGLGRSKGAIAVGCDADILVVDRRRTSEITDAQQVSRAAYTPFAGWIIPGTLTRVFLRGEEIVHDGKLVSERRGSVVTRES
ncbi:dihydroorotase family protein [Rhizobium sp. P38BS-XIX]|uniref:dihydroorotase n=1 Tax=Rhizobium sp. P38BS-XIX TaxID=2726740 RepID=UPI0014578E6C|nr:dihydroorotase family protein [Rhizobium sp. P38BS-XIX]NLR97517.1 dihydroorotase family protein [Rhizobium sp. P38BS-XIX]